MRLSLEERGCLDGVQICKTLDRYSGPESDKELYKWEDILYCFLADIGSRWSECKIGVIWSDFERFTLSPAATAGHMFI